MLILIGSVFFMMAFYKKGEAPINTQNKVPSLLYVENNENIDITDKSKIDVIKIITSKKQEKKRHIAILLTKWAVAWQKSGPGVWPCGLKLFSVLTFWFLLCQDKRNSPRGKWAANVVNIGSRLLYSNKITNAIRWVSIKKAQEICNRIFLNLNVFYLKLLIYQFWKICQFAAHDNKIYYANIVNFKLKTKLVYGFIFEGIAEADLSLRSTKCREKF